MRFATRCLLLVRRFCLSRVRPCPPPCLLLTRLDSLRFRCRWRCRWLVHSRDPDPLSPVRRCVVGARPAPARAELVAATLDKQTAGGGSTKDPRGGDAAAGRCSRTAGRQLERWRTVPRQRVSACSIAAVDFEGGADEERRETL